MNFDSTGLKTKPTWTVQTDATEIKGIGAKAVGYDASVNNADMTEEEKKLGTVETAPKQKKPKKAE